MANLLPRLTRLEGTVLDFLFPKRCVACGKPGDFICGSCRGLLVKITPPVCPKCGRPQPGGILCRTCLSWQAKIDGIRALFKFEGVIRQAVHSFKYHNLRALAGPLAQLLNDYLAANPVPAQVLVPVPLHGKRLRERGYNQTSLLARQLGILAKLPVVDNCLVRQHYALPQARTSSLSERHANVANAFACRDDRLLNRQVLLIDDVSTSGTTLDACAAAAKASGATSVWGLVIAKEV